MPPKNLDDRDRSIIDAKRVSARTVPRMVRRTQLREMVPLSDTTIYEMEQRGEFPRPFYLTSLRVLRPRGSRTLDRKSAAGFAGQGTGEFPGRSEAQDSTCEGRIGAEPRPPASGVVRSEEVRQRHSI